MSDQSSDVTPGWHCIIVEHFAEGSGANRHTKYRAQSRIDGQPPQELIFRFSEVDRLSQTLSRMTDLRNVSLPRIPSKVTLRSIISGRFDQTFLEERQTSMQEFFESLCTILNTKYAAIGNVLDLCDPLGQFVRRAAQHGLAAERAAIAAVDAAIRHEEDREIIVSQNREYEESLKADELRRLAEAEKAEQARQAALLEARKAEEEAAKANALAEDLKRRREAFEASYPEPTAGDSQATVRFRAASGGTIQRRFADATPISALFEFVAVSEWDGPAPGRSFDLRTSFPVRGLRGSEALTLKEAGLCPSSTLLVAEIDEASES